ncbi:hypothetical protein B0H10DRAFT_1946019 [Mycena sp. CBHHK59/15]|nr:hypothetical protein B0H10DRAFT_1946019 [Mycena sp. CBHHK59/15]
MGDGPFFESLVDNGIVRALTAAVLTINGAGVTLDVLGTGNMFLSLLRETFRGASGWSFTAIISSGTTTPGEGDIHNLLENILNSLLPVSTMYYAVLSQLEVSLLDIKDLQTTTLFKQSKIFKAWKSFTDLVEERLKAKKYFDSEECVSVKACDNIECGGIRKKKAFRRCVACHRRYYCSLNCQTVDWRAGHQNPEPANLSTRSSSFMRHLLQHDYEEAKRDISLRQLAFMNEHPAVDFYTIFDYCDGPGLIEIIPIPVPDSSQNAIGLMEALWMDHRARMSESSGRLDLHFMVVDEGREVHSRCIPLQSNISEVRDGLSCLAREIPQGTDISQLEQLFPELYKQFQAILNTKVVEIH